MKKSCGIFTNIAPIYSRPLWYELSISKNVDYFFYSSRTGFSGIKTIDINESKFYNNHGKLNWRFLKNMYIKNILFFQTGIIRNCLVARYDAYIINGEMQCISNWVAALVCKVRKKPVLFWSHGIYGDETRIKRTLRMLFYKIADYHLLYGERSRHLMINSGFSAERIYTVFNSLDYPAHKKLYEKMNQADLKVLKMELFPIQSELPVIIFIGRLTMHKKVSYLLDAVYKSKQKGNYYNCVIVGSGSEFGNLLQLSQSLGISEQVCFYGPCYDENINARLIMMADCCISPGNIGLTAIHSLSLGTPVITHRNFFNQGPEVETIIEDKTGLFFEEDDVKDLSDKIDDMILNRKKLSMKKYCIEQIEKCWNPRNQASVFDKAVLKSTE